MASPGGFKLTFLRGSGFLLSLAGAWDLMADEMGQWPLQKGFLIFDETKIVLVIERDATHRRGIEGTYSVEDNRIIITELLVDTAPEQGELGDIEFEMDGDMLAITWVSPNATRQIPHRIDRFRRRSHPGDRPVLPPTTAIYEAGGRERNG
jgi:hypothetical protein